MSKIYDNWERLVAAVLKKEQLWELFHADSIKTTSISSTSLNLSSNFNSISRDYDVFVPRKYDDDQRELVRTNRQKWAETENEITIVVKRSRGMAQNPKNLNNPKTYFSYDEDEKLIVYEYQSQGSQSDTLHGDGKRFGNSISWKSRLRIAFGVAKAIARVHAKENPNKLETDESSFGLGLDNTLVSKFDILTAGYRAPEVVYTNDVSQASDVYTFGVILLDLLTGRSPHNAIGVNTMNLVRWVSGMVQEKGTLVVFEFVPASNPKELIEMWKLLLVAMSCVVENKEKRPESRVVVKMMEVVMMSLEKIPRIFVLSDD